MTMISVRLFLREFNRLGEVERTIEQQAKLPAIPQLGQHLIVERGAATKAYQVSAAYMAVGKEEIVVFAYEGRIPYQDAVLVGILQGELMVPVQATFDGKTVQDLIDFLRVFAADDAVVFEDRQELVATSKTNYLFLRLDPPGT